MQESISSEFIKVTATPFFLETASGKVFAVYHCPADTSAIRGQILCVPPFNEEQNRCRSMITLQAQAFAKLGFATLVIDLYGTGDSEGDYNDARWSIWLENLSVAKAWLDQQPGGCQAIWGIRLGAMLAAEFHAQINSSEIALILWQPVIDGKTHLTQFFRVRIAAQMDRINLPKETTTTMRAQLSAGTSIEIAGYEIHPELAAAIDNIQLAKIPTVAGSRLLWLENVTPDKQDVSVASQNLLAQWPGDQVDIDVQGYVGYAFWQVHERTLTLSIIEQTTAWFGKVISA